VILAGTLHRTISSALSGGVETDALGADSPHILGASTHIEKIIRLQMKGGPTGSHASLQLLDEN
jgi:hypothetical protein